MEQGPVLVHLGLHKTGTTWFQEQLVPNLEGLEQPVSRTDLQSDLVFPGLGFDPDRFWDRHRASFQRVWDEGNVAVVSHEGLAGLPRRGAVGAEETALRLQRTFPEAHSIVFLREQKSVLQSSMSQALKRGSREPFHSKGGQNDPMTEQLAATLDHAARVRMYHSIFGDRFHPLLYEHLKQDQQATIDTILSPFGFKATGLPPMRAENRSLSRPASRILRAANHLLKPAPVYERGFLALPGRASFLRALSRMDRALRLAPWKPDAPWVEAWAEGFAASNHELAAMLQVDLGPLGYRLPEPSRTS